MTTVSRLAQAIRLPFGTAVWVLMAHLLTLLSPLVLLYVVQKEWLYVSGQMDFPFLFILAIILMMVSSAFEIAQNTIDEWFLTEDCASANGTSLCDFLFYAFLVLSMALIVIACAGSLWWVHVTILAGVIAFCGLYLTDHNPFPVLGIVGLASTLALYVTFDNPAVFLQMVCSQLTLYFFALLLTTGAQWLHGLTTGANAVGICVVAWAVNDAAQGQAASWLFVVGVALVTGLAALLLRPLFLKAQPTSPIV